MYLLHVGPVQAWKMRRDEETAAPGLDDLSAQIGRLDQEPQHAHHHRHRHHQNLLLDMTEADNALLRVHKTELSHRLHSLNQIIISRKHLNDSLACNLQRTIDI
ncbi:hypothetical protein K1719_042285 [Acacia pycnantha]|nr:hypothetical protein K1719_042285 [Acacia pycnantha]